MAKTFQTRERPGADPVAPVQRPQNAEGTAGNAALCQDSLDQAADGPESELPYLDALEAAFGQPLDHVGAHLGAADVLLPVGANAVAGGDTVAFAEEDPCLETVAHEVAHVVQDDGQAGSGPATRPGHATENEAEDVAHRVAAGGEAGSIEAGGGGVHADTLADVKPAARPTTEVSTVGVNLSDELVDSYFEKVRDGWGSSRGAPGGAKVVLGGIGAEYLTPMTSLAGELANASGTATDGSTVHAFPPNSTITVSLKLGKHKLADGAYRFTWTGAKADGTGGTVIVESLAGPSAPVQNTVTEDASASTATAGGVAFDLLGSWSGPALAGLNEALGLTPATALAAIKGVKFKKGGASPGGGEAGNYNPEKKVITMFDNAFAATSERSGTASEAARMISHEIGHALDLIPMYDPLGGGKTADDAAYAKGISDSGTKWSLKGDSYAADERPTWKGDDFRKAAIADGLGVSSKGKLSHGITDYGDTDWQELYAESFSLYTTDPTTLALLRPKTSAYFVKKFPRK